jgi:hypothetical protein
VHILHVQEELLVVKPERLNAPYPA